MAKSAQPRLNINLSSRGKKTIGKVFYSWAINAGRVIIVSIELIALAALGYRFIIDRQIVDLHDEIRAEESKIIAQSENEKLFRSIQQSLDHVSLVEKNNSQKLAVLNEVTRTVSDGVLYQTKITINEDRASIEGTTFSIQTLSSFIEALKNTPTVSEISVSEINTSDSGVTFRINLTIDEQT